MEFCTDLITEPEEITQILDFFSDKLRRLKNQLEKERIDYDDFLTAAQETKVETTFRKNMISELEKRLEGVDRRLGKQKRNFKSLDNNKVRLSQVEINQFKLRNHNRLLLEFSLDKLENEVAAAEKIVTALQKKLPPKE